MGHAYTGEKQNAYRMWVGKSDRMTPFQELWL